MTRRDFYQYKPYKTYFYTNKLFLEDYIGFARYANLNFVPFAQKDPPLIKLVNCYLFINFRILDFETINLVICCLFIKLSVVI